MSAPAALPFAVPAGPLIPPAGDVRASCGCCRTRRRREFAIEAARARDRGARLPGPPARHCDLSSGRRGGADGRTVLRRIAEPAAPRVRVLAMRQRQRVRLAVDRIVNRHESTRASAIGGQSSVPDWILLAKRRLNTSTSNASSTKYGRRPVDCKCADGPVQPCRIQQVVAQRQPAGAEPQRPAVLHAEEHGGRIGMRGQEPPDVDVAALAAPEIERVSIGGSPDAMPREQRRGGRNHHRIGRPQPASRQGVQATRPSTAS